MRLLTGLLLLAVATPAFADAPYYGPMKPWHGIGFKFGYKDDVDEDGRWIVKAVVHRGDAIDMAMYRAAERAHEQGYPFVQFLGGKGAHSPGLDVATIYVLPSRTPAAPTACRSKQEGTCYTASVAEVMRRLGGVDGQQPGVAVADHVDQYGRAVTYSGYGTGAVEGTGVAASTTTLAPVRPAIRGNVPTGYGAGAVLPRRP